MGICLEYTWNILGNMLDGDLLGIGNDGKWDWMQTRCPILPIRYGQKADDINRKNNLES